VVSEQFQLGGPDYQGATIFDMYHYWSAAGKVLNAETAFGNAPAENATEGDHWAWAPWAVPTTADWQTPSYMLNYTHGITDQGGNLLTDTEGNPVPAFGAYLWDGPLPDLVGDVRAAVEQSGQLSLDTNSPRTAAQIAEAGGTGLGPVLSVQILRI
jgi:hypothetical protein